MQRLIKDLARVEREEAKVVDRVAPDGVAGAFFAVAELEAADPGCVLTERSEMRRGQAAKRANGAKVSKASASG